MSQLIRSFLDPNSIEFGSSIFNDITNLGKIVKGVPLKLRLERGQSLDSFLLVLLQSVKEQKPKLTKIETIAEDIIGESLNNPMYSKPGRVSMKKSHVNNINISNKKPGRNFHNMNEILTTPFESFILLSKLIQKFVRVYRKIPIVRALVNKFISSKFLKLH